MADENYWRDRIGELENEVYQHSQQYIDDLKRQFKRASKNIQKDIERWYRRLADNNGISYAAAKKLLKASELEEFKWDVDDYIKAGKENDVSGIWMKELENASARYHINYLEAMQLQLRQHVEMLFAAYHADITAHLAQVYEGRYYKMAYEIAKNGGPIKKLAAIDTRRMEKVLLRPWAQDGEVFSDRIWKDKTKLIGSLHTELAQHITRGEAPVKAVKRLAQRMDTSISNAARLILTESAALASAAQKDCYQDLDVEKYEFVASLDNSTCEICGALDGMILRQPDFKIGINAPPMHPNCRCTTVPGYDDWEELGITPLRLMRDPKTGEGKMVSDLSYQEWKQAFVDNPKLQDATEDWPGENKKALLLDEKSISERKRETAVIYDAKGNFLFQKIGKENEVVFTRNEVKKMRDGVVSHNHPSGASFSTADISLLQKSKASEIRAIVEDGVYYLKKPPKWPKEINSPSKILKQREKIKNEVAKKLYKGYNIKGTKAQRFRQLSDEINREFAERYGLKYGKEGFED